MNIMFCIGSLGKGGAERVVANLCNYLSEENNVSIAMTKKNIQYNIKKNIKLFFLNKSNSKNFIKKNILMLFRLKQVISSSKPDVIICFLKEPTYRVLFLKFLCLIKRNIKVIISVRNNPNIIYEKFFDKLLMKILYNKANFFIFQTQDAKEYFSKNIQSKSIIIPNPINPDFVCKPYTGTREKSIVTVGRLVEQKNQKLLIDAFYEIQKENPEYVLRIYGEGPLKDKLCRYCNSLKIDNKVFFMGVVDNLKEEIYKSGIFVLTSDYEGMPNALMEAMAMGLPCISTDCPIGGPKFLIKNNLNGILFPVGNKDKLIENLKLLILDKSYASAIGNEANKIIKTLNPEKINQEWKKNIYNLIN